MLPLIYIMIQGFMALLFLFAVLHKLTDLPHFITVFRDYQIVPQKLAKAGAVMVLLAESAAVILLIANPLAGGILAATLLLAYAFGMAVNIMRGRRHIDCACNWRLQAHAMRAKYAPLNTISLKLVMRNMILAGLAMTLYLTHIAPPTLAELALAVSAAIFFFTAYMIADLLIVQARLIRQYIISQEQRTIIKEGLADA